MDNTRVAQQLLKIAKELTSADLYDMEQIVDYLKKKYITKYAVSVKGNDTGVSISVLRDTRLGFNVYASFRLTESRGGGSFYLTGDEIVTLDGDVDHKKRIKRTLQSDDRDSFNAKLNSKGLKWLVKQIDSWIGGTEWD